MATATVTPVVLQRVGSPGFAPLAIHRAEKRPQAALRLVALSLVCLAIGRAVLGQSPRIDSIEPSQGPIAGGTLITIKGANFDGATVTLDNVALTPQMLSDAEISFLNPAHDNGIASIKVATAAGVAYGEFLYVPPRLQDLPPGYITTVAGIGQFKGYYRLAIEASVNRATGLAFDRHGNLYIAEAAQNRVSRVNSDGILEPFAGNGHAWGGELDVGDGGPATEAIVNFPRGVTTDSEDNVYICENAYRIRRVDGCTGIITTIAGDGTPGFSGDGGPAVQAHLNDASRITGDGKGTLFFIDYDDISNTTRIRKVTPQGIISTVAGVGPPGFSGDGGPATQAQFNIPTGDQGGLALDPQGNLFVADQDNLRVRLIDVQTGIITTFAGPTSASGDTLRNIKAVTTDADGNVYYSYNSGGDSPHIVKLGPTGETLATYGTGWGFCEDGTPVQEVSLPSVIKALAIDAATNVVYSDTRFSRVRKLDFSTGNLETVAGCGPLPIGDNGPALAAVLDVANEGGDLAFLPSGELLIGDSGNFMLRKLDRQGNISAVAGPSNDLPVDPDEQPALSAYISPVGVEVDAAGRIFLADTNPNIWRIDPDGMVRRVAGIGEFGFAGDGGPALDASFCQPWDVAFDAAGNLFIADSNNNRIRRVDAQTGIVTTVAGSGKVNGAEHYGEGDSCGDGGPANQTCLNTPAGVAVDPAGNLYIAEDIYSRIRKVDTNGIMTTFAEDVGANKLVFDGVGNLYGAGGRRVFRFDRAGVATRLAGSRGEGFSGDGGPAVQARTRANGSATGLAIDAEGNLFFVDNGNYRVRAIRYGALLAPPTITTQPVSLNVRVGQATTLAVVAAGFPVPTYQWQKKGADIPGATNAIYTIANTQLSDAGSYTVVVRNLMGSVSSGAAVVTVYLPRVRRHLRGR